MSKPVFKEKKKIINLSSAEFAHRVLNIKVIPVPRHLVEDKVLIFFSPEIKFFPLLHKNMYH